MDFSEHVDEGHGGCCCPFCDNAVEAFDESATITAHGMRYVAHQMCIDEALEGADE